MSANTLCLTDISVPNLDRAIAFYNRIEFTDSVMNAIKTETFVCDTCGLRNRLNKAKRHKCEECDRGSPGEMR